LALSRWALKVRKKILKVFWATHGSRTHAEKAFQSAFLIRVLPEGLKFSACLKNLCRLLPFPSSPFALKSFRRSIILPKLLLTTL
jgi:hypothetical protein